jgi:hypothetical protein
LEGATPKKILAILPKNPSKGTPQNLHFLIALTIKKDIKNQNGNKNPGDKTDNCRTR